MAKSWKGTICKAISTALQSCRSKEPAILPVEVDYTGGGQPFNHDFTDASGVILHRQTSQSQEFKWGKEEEWHVVTRICNQTNTRRKIDSSSDDDPPFALPLPKASITGKKQRRGKKKKKKKNGGVCRSRVRLSTSSADSGWFTSDDRGGGQEEEKETETLISSTDSSIVRNRKSHFTHRRNRTRIPGRRHEASVASDVEIPARLSVFKKLLRCAVNAKVKESFAIVKRSSDPFEDFKTSMLEMIVEKQMFDRKDLEHLLLCFLSLNSRHYHGVIFEAFYEICETIFSPASRKPDRPSSMTAVPVVSPTSSPL